MKLNRTIQPTARLIDKIKFKKVENLSFQNGIECFYLSSNEQNALKLDFVFDAGYCYHQNSIIPSAVSQLMLEGTNTKSSKEINELLELQGAYVDTSANTDHIVLSVYCLKQQLTYILPIINDIVSQADFKQVEVDSFTAIQRRKFLVNQEKVSFLAKNKFIEHIYPKGHLYDHAIRESDFELIKREDLIKFYEQTIRNKKFRLYISGGVSQVELKLLQKNFQKIDYQAVPPKIVTDFSFKPKKEHLLKVDANQVAIRIGCPTINRQHADFPKLTIANTLLGGYFGSRLMTNLREDKGYTYGIGSGIATQKQGAYFYVSTELGWQYIKPAMKEIENEFHRLSTELVADKELELVKNYMRGMLLRNFDGTMATMDRFRFLNENGLDFSYYKLLLKALNETNSIEIMSIFQQYLTFQNMSIVSSGEPF